MNRCLACYQPLVGQPFGEYHPTCSRRLFGQSVPPTFPYDEAELRALAEQVVRQHITVPGVQPKISLALTSTEPSAAPTRFTIVGVLGNYILKLMRRNS